MGTTADELVSLVKTRCFWPTTNAPMSDAEILRLADAEISGSLWPRILAAQADYALSTLDHAVTATYSRYRLPARSYGPIKDVLFIDDGDTDDDAESMPLVNIEQLGHMRGSRGSYVSYIDGDYIGLYPTPTETRGTLRIRYYCAPSKLCVLADATTISNYDSATNPNRIVVESYTMTTPVAGDLMDIVSAGNAHQTLVASGEIDQVVASTNFDFEETLDGTGIQIGDYVAAAGFSPVLQIPDFMFSLLSYRVATAALMSSGDKDAARMAHGEAERQSALAEMTLSPRTESEPLTISPSFSALHLGRRGGRAWR